MNAKKTMMTLMVLLLWAGAAAAAVLQQVEWESKPGAPWDYTGGAPFIDCSVPPSPSGGCALQFVYPAGSYSTSFSGGRAVVSFASQNELWIGAWHRYSSGFVWNGNGTKRDFLVLQDTGAFGFPGNMATGWMGNPSAPSIVATNQIVWGTGTANFPCSYTAVTNQWVWMEEHHVINTPGVADGIFEQYVNGVRVCRYTNVPYRDSSVSTGWGLFYHTAEWGGGGGSIPATQYWWVDHTMISTTPIGVPGGAPPTIDTTPPAAPTGLTVTELWERFKLLMAAVWQMIGPDEANAAVPNDKLAISWANAQAGVDYELRWQSFADPDWLMLGLVPSVNLQRIVPLSPPISCAVGQDCWVCADARAKRLSDGVYGPWLSETPTGKACNQFAVGPLVLPPPPAPVPIPAPVPVGPATVGMSGDKVFIACDPTRYTRAKTTSTGTKRGITCIP